jgi:hypothetical protein
MFMTPPATVYALLFIAQETPSDQTQQGVVEYALPNAAAVRWASVT